MLDFKLFRQHVIGSFFDAPLFLTVWWATVSFLTLYLQPANSNWTFAGSSRISSFVVLFHLSRCTFTYAFYVLREIVDHSGLPQDSVLAVSAKIVLKLRERCFGVLADTFRTVHAVQPSKQLVSALLAASRRQLPPAAPSAASSAYEQTARGRRLADAT